MKEFALFEERRVVNKVCAYWNSVKGKKLYPNPSEIDFSEIMELLPYCFFLSVSYVGGENIKYTFHDVGEEISKEYEVENDMSFFSFDAGDSHISIISEILSPYLDEVITTREPNINELEYENKKGEYVLARQCLLPLGKKDLVTAILGVVRIKKS